METSYVILCQDGSGPEGAVRAWQHIATVSAASSEAAIRKVVAEDNGTADGIYVAVPSRSFKPTTVKTATKTVVSLG